MTTQEKYIKLRELGLSVKFLSNLTNIKTSLMYKWNSGDKLSDEKSNYINNTIEQLYSLYELGQKTDNSIRYENLMGKKFGHLTAIQAIGPNAKGAMQWACECDCGNKELKIATAYALKNKETTSCGCARYGRTPGNFKDLTGNRFGKLLVIERAENSSDNRVQWKCLCDCGKEKIIRSHSLLGGKTLSCGCLGSSIGEQNIETILQKNGIKYDKEFIFNDLISPKGYPLRFDFAIYKDNKIYLIEFDGRQHESSVLSFSETPQEKEYRVLCDKIKDDYCKKHNIPLKRISYKLRDTLTLEDIISG